MTVNPFGQQVPYLNGSSYGQSRDIGRDAGYDNGRDVGDDSMERIRDLLFGEMRREWDARLQTLETRLQTLEGKVDALRHQARTDREEHLNALSQGIDDLGQHLRRLTRG
jgi:hypothetical protein